MNLKRSDSAIKKGKGTNERKWELIEENQQVIMMTPENQK